MVATLNNPDEWADDLGATPPSQWQALVENGKYQFNEDSDAGYIDHIGTEDLPATLRLGYYVVEAPSTALLELDYRTATPGYTDVALNPAVGAHSITLTNHATTAATWQWRVKSHSGEAGGFEYGGVVYIWEEFCDYNCEYAVDGNARTLSDLRAELLAATGYASQASNPPPGIATKYNNFLRQSQEYLWRKYKALQVERFFTWQMQTGVRYYDHDQNFDCAAAQLLDRYSIKSVHVQDTNGTWWPLIKGIDPTFYTLDSNYGWPTHYEIRQCIEVFPAPQDLYKLRVLGNFLCNPFTADGNYTTIDAEPVLLWAIGMAKADKGASDAGNYFQMARDYIGGLRAGTHASARYIPNQRNLPVPTPPTMVEFI